METMRYQENKKTSKWPIVAFFLFLFLGGGLVFMAIKTEKSPEVVGGYREEVQGLVDIYSEETMSKIEPIDRVEDIAFQIVEEKVSDQSNQNFKSAISLPKVLIQGEELTTFNQKIKEQYTGLYASLKEEMKEVENPFTFKTTYKYYDNIVGDKRILSITIHQRIVDDKEKATTTDKIETYNIDLSTKELVEESKIAQTLFGKEYKSFIRNQVRDYVTKNNMMKEEEFVYALTGLENYYMKNGIFHLIFNEAELVDKKYKVLDIEIVKDSASEK